MTTNFLYVFLLCFATSICTTIVLVVIHDMRQRNLPSCLDCGRRFHRYNGATQCDRCRLARRDTLVKEYAETITNFRRALTDAGFSPHVDTIYRPNMSQTGMPPVREAFAVLCRAGDLLKHVRAEGHRFVPGEGWQPCEVCLGHLRWFSSLPSD